jgi:hypothetical protein
MYILDKQEAQEGILAQGRIGEHLPRNFGRAWTVDHMSIHVHVLYEYSLNHLSARARRASKYMYSI